MSMTEFAMKLKAVENAVSWGKLSRRLAPVAGETVDALTFDNNSSWRAYEGALSEHRMRLMDEELLRPGLYSAE
jgi:hypothetical protein